MSLPLFIERRLLCPDQIERQGNPVSLKTTDPALARRNLSKLRNEQSQIDRSKNRVALPELCNSFLKTIQHQRPKIDWEQFSRDLIEVCSMGAFMLFRASQMSKCAARSEYLRDVADAGALAM